MPKDLLQALHSKVRSASVSPNRDHQHKAPAKPIAVRAASQSFDDIARAPDAVEDVAMKNLRGQAFIYAKQASKFDRYDLKRIIDFDTISPNDPSLTEKERKLVIEVQVMSAALNAHFSWDDKSDS